jgi:hypothetical protein
MVEIGAGVGAVAAPAVATGAATASDAMIAPRVAVFLIVITSFTFLWKILRCTVD